MSKPARPGGPALRRDLAAALLFLALTLAVMGPAALAPRTTVIGWEGDNVQHAYAVGWTAQALLLGRSPFTDPRLNYPGDLQLMTTDLAYLLQMTVAPATWAMGPIFGYNLIVALSFFLSGLVPYLWVQRLTGSRAGGLVAGLVFLLAPYRVAHSFGHLQLTVTFPLPLFFWALDAALRREGRALPAWLALTGATLLLGGTSQYYLIIGLLGGAFYGLLRLRAAGWRQRAATLTAVLVGAALSATPYLLALGSRSFTPYSVEETRGWSASPANFLLPSPYHPLWGNLVERLRPEPLWIEKALYVGLVALTLAVFALVAERRLLAGRAAAWAGVAAVGFVFALGTDLHLGNVPVQPETPFWLPAYYLSWLPGMDLVRVWARFGVLTVLFVALLAGVGAAGLARRLPRQAAAVGVTLALLAILDMAPGSLPSATLGPRPVDRWLAEQPGDVVAAALPIYNDSTNYWTLFGSLFHARHMPAFMHPAHVPPAYRDFAARAAGFPSAESVAALRTLGVRYILLQQRSYDGAGGPPWPEVLAGIEVAGLPIVADLDGVVVVDLMASAAAE